MKDLPPGVDDYIRKLAMKYVRRLPASVDKDDLIQEGRIAALKAMERYEEREGKELHAFLRPNIMGGMIDYIRDRGALVKFPRHYQNKYTAYVWIDQPLDYGEEDELRFGYAVMPDLDIIKQLRMIDEIAESMMSNRSWQIAMRIWREESTAHEEAARFGVTPPRISQIIKEVRKEIMRKLSGSNTIRENREVQAEPVYVDADLPEIVRPACDGKVPAEMADLVKGFDFEKLMRETN